MSVKIKIALGSLEKMIIRRVGIGTAAGAGVGAFSGHRLEKRKAERFNPYTGKSEKITAAKSALSGAYVGGLIGLSHAAYSGHIDRDTVKRAKSAWRASGVPFKERHEGVVGAATGAAALGGLGYAVGKHGEKKKDPKHRTDRWGSAAAGAAMGAGYGHMLGNMRRLGRISNHSAQHAGQRHRTTAEGNFDFGRGAGDDVPTPGWARGAKTKKEAKKRYRDEATRHHPDHGGDPEKMKKINTEWENWEKSPGFDKLGYVLAALLDELEKLGTKIPHPLTAPTPSMSLPVSQPRTPVRGRTSAPPNMDQGAGQVSIPPMV